VIFLYSNLRLRLDFSANVMRLPLYSANGPFKA